MTNRLALVLFVLIVAALAGDAWFNDSAATVFMLKKMSALQEWMAFWR